MIINIGRQLAAGGRAIGKKIAQALHYTYYDKELLFEAAKQSGYSAEMFANADEEHSVFLSAFGSQNAQLFQMQAETIQTLAEQGNCVFIGRCADYVLRERTDCLNLFLTADKEERIRRIQAEEHLTVKQAEDKINKTEKRRAEYYSFYTGKRWGDATSYDLCINTSLLSDDEIVSIIKQIVQTKENRD